jgi:uncharacterized protein YxjI
LKPFVQPKIESIRRGGKNRFDVALSLGSIGSVTDAQALTEVAVDELVAQIKNNWTQGKKADGSTQAPRAKESSIGPGYPEFDEKKKVEIEGDILDGKFKVKKPKPPKRQTAKAQTKYQQKLKSYEKRKKTLATVKKNYQWKKIYKPVYGLPALNRSGMMVDTLRRDTVRIKERNGVIPNKVTTRIIVSPKRGDAVGRLRLIQMDATSPAYQAATKAMAEGVQVSTTFKSYKEASVNADEIIRKFFVWAWRKKIIQKIIGQLRGAISNG